MPGDHPDGRPAQSAVLGDHLFCYLCRVTAQLVTQHCRLRQATIWAVTRHDHPSNGQLCRVTARMVAQRSRLSWVTTRAGNCPG
jgi:hypothetical protein